MRSAMVAGNWKLHGSRASAEQLLTQLLPLSDVAGVDVVVCPTFAYLDTVAQKCSASPVMVGAQDCSHMPSGAYTGEVAAQMLADVGCRWVIVGHSERRQYHAESDELIAAKLKAAAEAGIAPILCVGETRDQRESGEAESVVGTQLRGALADNVALAGLVVAYEPVWAIGTGLTASPGQAQEMHAFIRAFLGDELGLSAQTIRILYGGSVKAANAAELFGQPDIDGALVGGASLDAQEFGAIISAAAL